MTQPTSHTSILFELASAYGTVGLTLGYPNYVPSFSGKFRPFSKLVVMAVMMAGRHRGFPDSIDQAFQPVSQLTTRYFEIHSRCSLHTPSPTGKVVFNDSVKTKPISVDRGSPHHHLFKMPFVFNTPSLPPSRPSFGSGLRIVGPTSTPSTPATAGHSSV